MKATRVRAIVVGADFQTLNSNGIVAKLQDFYAVAEKSYNDAAFLVQTRRLTLPPLMLIDPSSGYQIKSMLDSLSRMAETLAIRWICVPMRANANWHSEWIQLITNLISIYPKFFFHFMAAEKGEISSVLPALAARTILAISRLSNNGYDNFRVGVGANINPNTPYFPFSYHEGNTGFSLAVELIGDMIHTVKSAGTISLEKMRERLIEIISPIVLEIDAIGINLEQLTGFEYKGQDISIAPFPDEHRSVALLIELLGLEHCGQAGTLLITSLLTDVLKTVIKRTKIRHVGFNGVMFSLLEDIQLAKSNNYRHLSLEKLMNYSAVCGCGIDMVPVPGDVFEEELSSLILDVAALSTVLKKPLGVRVLPIPLKSANELTNFNHDFLTNTRILALNGQQRALSLSSEPTIHYLKEI